MGGVRAGRTPGLPLRCHSKREFPTGNPSTGKGHRLWTARSEWMSEWTNEGIRHMFTVLLYRFKTIYLILLFGNLTFFNRKKISLACMHVLSVYLLLLYHYHCHHHYFRGYYRDLLPCGFFSRNCISLLGFRFCSVPVIPPTSVQFSQTTMDLFPLTAHCWGHSVNTGAWKFRNITSSWFLLA